MKLLMARVYVGKLPPRVDELDLEKLFSEAGPVRNVNIKYDFAFIEFDHESDAQKAIRDFDGYDLDGRRIIVEMARDKRRYGSRSPVRSRGNSRRFRYLFFFSTS